VVAVTFRETAFVIVASKHALCHAGERLVFNTEQANLIAKSPADNVHEYVDLTSYIQQQKPPADWKGRKVLFYRRSGGIGDIIMATCLPRYFKEVLGAECHVASERAHAELWTNNSSVTGLPLLMPINMDCVWRYKAPPFFHYSFFIESVGESNGDSEQSSYYDVLFGLCGIDPATVPSEWKRPFFTLAPEELQARDTALQTLGTAYGRDLSKGYIALQPLSVDSTKSFPVSLIAEVLAGANEVAEELGYSILVLHCTAFDPEIVTMIEQTPTAINTSGMIPNVRTFAALLQGSRAIICPDSASLHFGAAFGTPTLGIFGSHSPEVVAPYQHPHHWIWHQSQCPNSPCFNTAPTLPFHKCPDGEKATHCVVFDGITSQEIHAALTELLQ
jgi:ADP-heptose:LPS heptosyltransferase